MEKVIYALASEVVQVKSLLGGQCVHIETLQSLIDELLYQYTRTVINLFPTGIWEIECMILNHLDNKSLKNIFSTNKHMHELGMNDRFWKQKIIKEYGKEYDLTNYIRGDDCHRKAYKRLTLPYLSGTCAISLSANAHVGSIYGYVPFVRSYIQLVKDDVDHQEELKELAIGALEHKHTSLFAEIITSIKTLPSGSDLFSEIIYNSSLENKAF